MPKPDSSHEITAGTTAQGEPTRRPYEPPTLSRRGSLSALVGETVTPPPNVSVVLSTG